MFGIRRFVPARPEAAAICAAVCLLPSLAVFAAEAAEAPSDPAAVEDKIVVTATRVETPLSQVGSSVTVLAGDDLRERGFSSVSDALRSAPGLDLARSGGPGQTTSVFLRGGSSSQTLVLLDGVRLNGTTTGAYDFADLSLDEVERIEIVRGPQSPLYGSEAAAGVIQIFTRRGEPGFEAAALGEIGEDDHHRLRASLGGGSDDGRWSGRLSAADERLNAVSAADPRNGNSELDRHDNLTLTGNLGFAPNESHRFDLDVRYFDAEVAIDGYAFPAGPVDSLTAELAREAKVAGFSYLGQAGSQLSLEARFGYTDDDLEGKDAADPFGNYVIESRSQELGFQATYDAGNHRLTAGASREERRGGTENTFDADVDIDGIYLQDLIRLGERVSLTLGVRRDDHSTFGAEETGRAALAVEAWSAGRLHASWGQGFKAPTLNDLYYPFFSNPDLQPERSESFDFGIEHSFGAFLADLTYFDSDFEDLIAYDFVSARPENIAAATSRGVESQLRWRPEGGRVQAGVTYTWNETEDEALGTPLARRPKRRATADVSWRPADAWRVAVHALSVADRIDSDGSELEDYTRFDVSAAYRAGRFEPSLRVLNVGDDDTSEIGGYGAQGRTAILAVAVDF